MIILPNMKAKKSILWKIIIRLIFVMAILFFLSSGILVLWIINLPIPDFNSFEERVVAQSTKIYDRTGKILLYDVHENIKRTLIPIEEIPAYMQKATIAIEDTNFYKHAGIRPTAILRAFIINVMTGTVEQGGSTLTQQVVKNTLLTQDKKISRKIKEVILSFKVEQALSKDQILELYLNESPYGGNIYGIEEAAKTYFGKSAIDISLAEAAYLAALPQAPTYLSPYGNHKNQLENRKNLTLSKMLNLGFISQEDFDEAKAEEVIFIKPEEKNIKAPHFVFFILDYLENKYGEDLIRNGGLRVTTTLDWSAQQKAEEIVKTYGQKNAINFNANNAGLVAMDPKTGHILAMVGSVDYFDVENSGNFNVTTAKRQPGSAFKPFVYAAALEKGYTPETVVFDLPTEFNVNCSPNGIPVTGDADCYSPVNYDNVFLGPVTFRQALAQSRNIPAVKILYLTGIENAIKTARSFGITTLTDASRYGLTLVLGGGEVTLLEMVNAYGVFATEGIRHPYVGILKIEDGQKQTLEEFKDSSNRVLSINVAREISSILSDNIARTPAFGPNSLLKISNRDVAVKTGTTNDYRDAWTIGYTPDLVVGAWAGNNDNSSMEKKVAGLIITPLWNAFITEYLKDKPISFFGRPDPLSADLKPILKGQWQGGQSYYINSVTGEIASEDTPEELKELKIISQIHSILYWVNKNNPRGPIPQNPNLDEQFILWETPVRNWIDRQNII